MAAPARLGAVLVEDGLSVAVVSTTAERIFFCLFDEPGEREVARVPLAERDGNVHFDVIPNVGAGARYGLRADGPYDPANGHWFDPAKLLVDPYATRLDRPFAYRPELAAPRHAEIDTAAMVPKAIVAAGMPALSPGLRRPPQAVYEIAVKAFTKRHPAIPAPLRGTLAGLAHPAAIEHLVRLGVDTVELTPIAAWIDERHLPPLGLANAWGYNPVTFLAPDPRLAPGGLAEVRATVAALHAAGIGVILDVVFNHTGESDVLGPTLSLRGLDNSLYYRGAADDPGKLVNDTGCGNTLAAERPEVVRLILDAMRHWAGQTGVDGFRLDLAASLGRLPSGFSRDAPLFAAVAADPLLSRLTMIAEPWDVGPDGYQLGNFPGGWREWNDRFRDDVRRFWRGDGSAAALATRLAGSSDIFENRDRQPSASINFLAAHDGFALNDLVSYAQKHNERNGEQNRDGTGENLSWNHGVEGGTHDPGVEEARRVDLRVLLATLYAARGTPMLTAGDEFRRTQGGNNNAYAQDNAVTWLDWANADTELAAFAARLVALRRAHPALSADAFLTGLPLDDTAIPDVAWFRPDGREMTVADWKRDARILGMVLYRSAGSAAADRVAIWFNAAVHSVGAWLPRPRPLHRWQTILDSASGDADRKPAPEGRIVLPARSVLIFAEASA
jgi:glycogen operon protein